MVTKETKREETDLIRVYKKDKESLKRRGFYGESIADILTRELTMSEYWKAEEQKKDFNKAIQNKMDSKFKPKKGNRIKTPRENINKMIQWKMESSEKF